MVDYGLPALFAALVWWFTTGVILWLDGLPRATHRWSMLAVTLVSLLGAGGLWHGAHDDSVAGAYCSFASAVMVWAWLEMSFLMGYVTGPRRTASPPDHDGGWPHFRRAAETVVYHELAIAAVGVGVFITTRDAVDPVGWWTFLVLWAMRLSAKLNLFLGVPNVNGELLPPHLQYLRGYFRTRPMNRLFPVSIAGSGATAGWLAVELSGRHTGSAGATALTLVLALLALAILEHGFMVLPLPANQLWRWAIGADRSIAAAAPSGNAPVTPH